MLAPAKSHSPTFWKTAFPTDEEIVRRVVAGELPLFEVLMRRHNQRIYRAIRAILRDEAEVEDVMQQTYVSAYSNLAQFAGTARFSTWITKIAINEALARVRRAAHFGSGLELARSEDEVPMKLASEDPNPEERLRARELASILESTIDALPELSRSVVMLREIEGMSTAETAEVLGVTEDVIKTRLHRAKHQLREQFLEQMKGQTADAFLFYDPRCDRVVARVFARIQGSAEI